MSLQDAAAQKHAVTALFEDRSLDPAAGEKPPATQGPRNRGCACKLTGSLIHNFGEKPKRMHLSFAPRTGSGEVRVSAAEFQFVRAAQPNTSRSNKHASCSVLKSGKQDKLGFANRSPLLGLRSAWKMRFQKNGQRLRMVWNKTKNDESQFTQNASSPGGNRRVALCFLSGENHG